MPLPSYLQFRQPPPHLLAQVPVPGSQPRVPAPAPTTPAPSAPGGSSEVYLVGGVHRVGDKKNQHDECPWQYYTSANRVVQDRLAALKKAGSTDKVTVLMYAPAYEVRATNDKKTAASLN